MIGSLERLWLRTHVRRLAPMMLLAVGVPVVRPDPISKRSIGYAGVLPIPAPAAATPATTASMDSLLGHRFGRIDKGRVLYAAGRGPRDSLTTTPRVLDPHMLRKHPCPEQRVVQSHGPPAPNS